MWACALLSLVAVGSAAHTEGLAVTPLDDAHSLAVFSFGYQGRWPSINASLGFPIRVLDFEPAALLQAMQDSGTSEFYLSFRHGRWNWGVEAGAALPPLGAHIRAWLDPPPSGSWQRLLRSLDGIFCVSLAASQEHSRSPVLHLLERDFVRKATDRRPLDLVALFLPHEPSCTENLMPIIRQLPCRQHAGLATLLRPDALFSSLDHAVIASAQREGKDNVTVSFTVQMVLPMEEAHSLEVQAAGVTRCALSSLLPSLPVIDGTLTLSDSPPEVQVTRWHTGSSLLRAVLHSSFSFTSTHGHNNTTVAGAASVSLSVLEALPSFLSPFVHTCALTLLLPGGLLAGSWPLFRCPHVTSASYEPSDAPGGPSLLRYTLTLPAGSTATVSLTVARRLLHVDSYPPDPNRGFDLPPLVLTTLHSDGSAAGGPRFSEPMLIDMPAPDFSMPFNVVTLCCTVMSLFCGTFINILARKPRAQKA